MRARDLSDAGPVVGLGDDALATVSELVRHRWDGLVVVDDGGRALATVSLAQVLRLALPDFIEDDPALASVYQESAADLLGNYLQGEQLGRLLPKPSHPPVVVAADANLFEISVEMAVRQTAIVAVTERRTGGGPVIGAITASNVLAAIVPSEQGGTPGAAGRDADD